MTDDRIARFPHGFLKNSLFYFTENSLKRGLENNMPEEETTPRTRSAEEKGHAKNLEVIKKLRDFATSWGANYAPTNPILLLPFMTQRINDAEFVSDDVIDTRAPYRVAASVAEDAFALVSERITRLERGFSASGVPQSAVEDLKIDTRKIKSGAKKSGGTTGGDGIVEKGHSASQMSRANRTERLDSAIATLIQYGFDPNESDLKIPALQEWSDDLKAKTDAVSTAYIPLSNKLDKRDEIYYIASDSLYQIWLAFEDYVISRFGMNSNEHNQIRGLDFKKYTRKKNQG